MHVGTHGRYAEACEDTATRYKHERTWAGEVHRRGKQAGAGPEGCERRIPENLCFEEALRQEGDNRIHTSEQSSEDLVERTVGVAAEGAEPGDQPGFLAWGPLMQS